MATPVPDVANAECGGAAEKSHISPPYSNTGRVRLVPPRDFVAACPGELDAEAMGFGLHGYPAY